MGSAVHIGKSQDSDRMLQWIKVVSTDIPEHSSQFVQDAADDVDHNIRTLDNNNTFHGMGIIVMVTAGTTHNHIVPRSQITTSDVASTGLIQVQYYREDNRVIADIKYTDIPVITAEDPTANLDILWQTSLLFSPTRAAWGGMMQCIHCNNHPGKSSVIFLPMIDMSSSDLHAYTCTIHSTM